MTTTGTITVGHGQTPIQIPTTTRATDLVITAVSDDPAHCGGGPTQPTISDIQVTSTGFGFTVTNPGAVATVTWSYDESQIEARWRYYLALTRNEVAASVLVLAELLEQPQVQSQPTRANAGDPNTEAVQAVRSLLGLYVDQRNLLSAS